jgi:drug/metabolite transporter (DMT)-like permease
MLTFIALCLLARFGYSLNDIFIGRLARKHGRMEIAAFRGVTLGVSMAPCLMACAVFGVKRLAHATHPLLTAWAWELGSGLILLGPVLLRGRLRSSVGLGKRVFRIAIAALPTAVASGASVLALGLGELGLWGALGGTQILFTAGLGAPWHHETLGLRRWVCMTVAVAAVAGLAVAGG